MTNVTKLGQHLRLAFGIADVKAYLGLQRSDDLNPAYVGIWSAFAECQPESPGLFMLYEGPAFSCFFVSFTGQSDFAWFFNLSKDKNYSGIFLLELYQNVFFPKLPKIAENSNAVSYFWI